MGTMTTKSKQQTNNLNGEKYFMRIESPKIIDCTIIVKPLTKGETEERKVEEEKKDSLSKKVKEAEESIKHGLHIDNK